MYLVYSGIVSMLPFRISETNCAFLSFSLPSSSFLVGNG